MNIEINRMEKEQYPFLLRQINRLPKSMDRIGQMPSDDHKFLCIVGSRRNTDYGKEACDKLLSGLKGYPIVIVSGLAIGIDSIAHESAIRHGIKTIAFPGSGLDHRVLYPAIHRRLAMKIVESGGAIVSPFARDQRGAEWTFPVRNRLMAGISHATLIVEAKRHSGTLITADYAAEFGRDIMTVPGSIFSDNSYGPHMLLRRGAIPVSTSADILEALGFRILRDQTESALPNFAEMSLNGDEKIIIDLLRSERLSTSQIIDKTGHSASHLSSIISELELRGLIAENDGVYRLS